VFPIRCGETYRNELAGAIINDGLPDLQPVAVLVPRTSGPKNHEYLYRREETMKRIQLMVFCWCLVFVITAIPGMGLAAVFLHEPYWEAPGGFSSSDSGIPPAHAGGLTRTYTDFDPTACDALYYVVGDYDYDPGPPETWTFNGMGPAIGTAFNEMTRLTYDAAASDLAGGKVVWDETIFIYDASTSTNRPYAARFTLQVYPSTALIDAATVNGMDQRVGGAHPVQGSFSANWLFELAEPSSPTWQAAMPFFDGLSTAPSDALHTSVTSAFYYIGCFGDYHNDGDVDGADLAAYTIDPAGFNLADVAANFGREDCS
jgi:hypothetical protein